MTGKTAGVFGLGSMGSGIAGSLLRGGLDVVGFDIYEPARARLVAAGGRVAGRDQVLAESDVVVMSVLDDAQARDVLFDGDTPRPMKPGAVVICTSTVSFDFVVNAAKALEAVGIGFLDAPVSGGPARAATGELATYLAGKPQDVDRAMFALEKIAKPLYRVSETVGQGTALKLFNQLLVAGHLAVGAQALAFARHLGLDLGQGIEMMQASAGNSWVLQNLLPRHIAGDYEPRATLATLLKDVRIIQKVSEVRSIYNPVNAFVLDLLEQAGQDGGLMKDGVIVAKYLTEHEA